MAAQMNSGPGAMTDVAEYERRIGAALSRISDGIARLREAAPGQTPAFRPGTAAGADIGALQAALDDERTANAQLEDRLKALRDRHEAREAAIAAERAALRTRLAELDGVLQGLRASQADLNEVVAQVRSALAAQVAEPELVNRAMQAELDGLRALRRADAAEVDAVISELRPMIEERR